VAQLSHPTLFGKPKTLDKVMTVQSVNPHVVEFEYAVRGEIAIRAEEIKAVSAFALEEFRS
jgi:hypothetical protein